MFFSSPARIKRGLFYAKFYADFYANSRQALYFGLFFMGIFHANFKGKLFILPHNIHDIKRHPPVAVHLQYSTYGLFVNKCTNNCLVTMLRSLLTRHRETIKDQRVHTSYLFCWVLGNRSLGPEVSRFLGPKYR